MSKLGSAPPPPPYKVPLSERLFGIGKLRPPVTAGVEHGSGDALPATIRLGDFTLVMDARGEWQMSSALVSMYQSQITALESKVAQLEDERLSRNVFELEKSNIALERKQLDLQEENNQLKFKNKVLMAMCTISEGDYKSLCKEAGLEPRAQKKPLPAAAPQSTSNAQQQYAQMQAQAQAPLSASQGPATGSYPNQQRAPSLNVAASPMSNDGQQQQQQFDRQRSAY